MTGSITLELTQVKDKEADLDGEEVSCFFSIGRDCMLADYQDVGGIVAKNKRLTSLLKVSG